jgi:DNA repair photolyase
MEEKRDRSGSSRFELAADEEGREMSEQSPAPPRGRGAASNPGSRFNTLNFEPDPDAYEPEDGLDKRTRYLSDKSRSIISRNNSPDIPFDVSLNPYRGCEHGCSYCLWADTPVLMADGSYRAIQSLRKGDRIYGTVLKGQYRRFVRTEVLDHWSSYRHAYRITLGDGTELIASGDHTFLTEGGWKHVSDNEKGRRQRSHLTLNNRLLGTGKFAQSPEPKEAYRQGYLCGMIRGDGHLSTYLVAHKGRSWIKSHFRLALTDPEALERTRRYLAIVDVKTRSFVFSPATGNRSKVVAISAQNRVSYETISQQIKWPKAPPEDWQKGFLAGLFDAEGSYRDGILRIHNTDDEIVGAAIASLDSLAFEMMIESSLTQSGKNLGSIRVTGGIQAHLRFFHMTNPAIRRKCSIEGQAIKNSVDLRVTKIEDLGIEIPMFDITTGTGDFIADGVVSHNCYARPSHEYLGFSPGLDFERMIMVKEDAPKLLESELRKKSWEPKTLLLSGVTDPYQPVERKLELTRACLEVLRDFRHPVSVITKNHLVTRDIDILSELAEYDASHVTLSITTLNEELRRRLEPRTSTGMRRVDAVRELAGAGIPVSVNVAPVIPGLNDEEIPAILEAAAEAGARAAHFILVRLPGAVEPLFLEWLEAHYPLRKEKVLGRLRQARGGKLNEAAFGKRMRGSGPYAESIRTLFHVHRKRQGLSERSFLLSGEHFRVPGSSSQPGLFEMP